MNKVLLTPDEIISTLNHSSLPTLVIEGRDDVIIFRKIEEQHSDIGLSILAAGGRPTTLEIFNRRSEISNGQKIMFVADQDFWISAGIPSNYKSDLLLFTNGYSIENDVFADGGLENLMSAQERVCFEKDLAKIIEWYALALSRKLAGEDYKISVHPNELLDNQKRWLKAIVVRTGETYPTSLKDQISVDYAKLLRGKTLLAVLMRQLSYSRRSARHNHRSLFEIVANRRGPLLNKMFDKIRGGFAP